MKILRLINYIVASFVILLILLVFFSRLPLAGNIQFLVVQSGSMQPALKQGSIITIKPANSYQAGDIITFSLSEGQDPITHRLAEIKQEGRKTIYITKGDANRVVDQWKVLESQVKGKVIFHIPYLGYVVDFSRKPIGFLLLITIPALIVIMAETRKIIKELKKDEKHSS